MFDVIVIGGGPGGYVAAIKAAQHGKNTCLVEAKSIGGTCLNEGCIPTKTLIKTADTFQTIKESGSFAVDGVSLDSISISGKKLQERKNKIITQLQQGIQGLLKKNKIVVKEGQAKFVDAHTISVNGEKLTANNFIIATGSKASIPKFIKTSNDAKIMTSGDLLNIDKIPASITIIGGGVIGIEFAFVLNKFGTKVTVIEAMPKILPMIDEEIAMSAHKRLKKDGVTIHTDAKVSEIKGNVVIFDEKGSPKTVESELTLVAIGRQPNTEGLDVEKAGVKKNGLAIDVDTKLRTNIPHIYAIGDVNGKLALAHKASYEGKVAVQNICGENEDADYSKVPSCIYTIPEIASVGISEKAAKEQYDDIRVGKFPMSANSKSLIEGETDGMIKVVAEGKTGEILGVHLFGLHATEMIGGIASLMTAEATVDELLASIFPHPSASEAIGEAFLGVFGSPVHI